MLLIDMQHKKCLSDKNCIMYEEGHVLICMVIQTTQINHIQIFTVIFALLKKIILTQTIENMVKYCIIASGHCNKSIFQQKWTH